MFSSLYNHTNYTAKIDYLISSYIREYDISKANINILLKSGIISNDEYNYYYNLDKTNRQIQIGLLQKSNPRVTDALKSGIIEAKRLFFEANGIQDYEVLSIKNDAVFLINKIPTITKFGNIEFACKNMYTSFYKLSNKEYYYFYDSVTGVENLEIKGIGNESIEYHKEYFVDFLLYIFNSAQTMPIEDTIGSLKEFYLNYIDKKLAIGYYRRLDSESAFQMKRISRYSDYKAKFLLEEDIDTIDISYNLNILRQLYKIYSGIYFQKR